MGLTLRLEHDGGEWRVVLRVNLHRVLALRASEGMQLLHFVRIRHEFDNGCQNGARAVVQRGRRAEQRK